MMTLAGSTFQKAAATLCVLLLPISASFGQAPLSAPPDAPVSAQQAAPLLSPQQLDNLVAPVALYPDPLLGQVMAASTYPLEITEALQWMQRNGSLQGTQLMDAARQQNWDPSIQALVAFPDALKLLGNDIRWTTDLGNAFLAQQADVMTAVQRMRSRAQANGRLATTQQQTVTTETQNGQSAIEIQPTDPQVIYVPVYQPEYVYGPSDWGAYPDLWYPPWFGYGVGFGFGPGIYGSLFFPGWGGWGGWGWGLGWFGGGFGRGLFVNAGFFNRFGFRAGLGAGGFGGRSAWGHDPGHRMGVPYSNAAVASRFNSGRFAGANRASAGQSTASRSFAANTGRSSGANTGRSFSSNTGRAAGSAQVNRGATTNGGFRSFNGDNRVAGNAYRGGATSQGYRGAAPSQSYRSAPSPSRSYSAPRAQSFSAPRSYSAPSRSYSAPRSSGGGFSGGHSGGGGFSGGHAGGGGGHGGGHR